MASPVMASTVKVGISVHDSLMVADPVRRRSLLSRIEQAGLDYVCVGDHVSFHDGTGFDGLTAATAALCEGRLPVLVGVYLLALRHPMLTARQLASISRGPRRPGTASTYGAGWTPTPRRPGACWPASSRACTTSRSENSNG